MSSQVTPDELPVVIATGSVLRRPTPGALAEYLGLTVESLPGRCFDLVVVGAGPAGLAAAVYGASEGLGDLCARHDRDGRPGRDELADRELLRLPDRHLRGRPHATGHGASGEVRRPLVNPCAAVSLREKAGHLVVDLTDGTSVAGRAVIVATGARYRRLDAAAARAVRSNGVFYAATELEARLCAGSPVVVAGGGNSAGQASLFLAEKGCHVTHRGPWP